jgi:flagellar basal body rod protein FlgB
MYGEINSISRIISSLSANQKITAHNVANAQTPGYVRQVPSFSDTLGNMNNPFETTLSAKMGSLMPQTLARQTGKPVDLSEEFLLMQKYFLDYSVVTRRASSIFNNLRRASQIGR